MFKITITRIIIGFEIAWILCWITGIWFFHWQLFVTGFLVFVIGAVVWKVEQLMVPRLNYCPHCGSRIIYKKE